MKQIVVYLLLAILTGLAALAPRSVVDNSLEIWIEHDTREGKQWRQFVAEFGSSEFLVIAVTGRNHLFRIDIIDQLAGLESRLQQMKAVKSVLGPGTIYRQVFGDKGIAAFREEMTLSPFYRSLLISADHKTLAIFRPFRENSARPIGAPGNHHDRTT